MRALYGRTGVSLCECPVQLPELYSMLKGISNMYTMSLWLFERSNTCGSSRSYGRYPIPRTTNHRHNKRRSSHRRCLESIQEVASIAEMAWQEARRGQGKAGGTGRR